MKKQNYYLGLDIGTNSVGYSVTDENYAPIKFKGEQMMGVHVFDSASTSQERRTFRSARRRLDRRQQRIMLLQELFAKEISKVDERFFIRIKESGLCREDVTCSSDKNILFNDEGFSDKDYYKQYSTIHHLIDELMKSSKPHDVRLVYIACAWLVAHRGHFLNEVDKQSIEKVLDFTPIYMELQEYLTEHEITAWDFTDTEAFGKILKKHNGITAKIKEFYQMLFDSKKPRDSTVNGMITLLCGGKVQLKDLYKNESYTDLDIKAVSLGMKDEDFVAAIAQIGDDSELLLKLKALYDWAVLSDILGENKTISEAKIQVYNRHKEDLAFLKKFIKKYCPQKYDEVFKTVSDKLKNYVAYSYNTKNYNILPESDIQNLKSATKEDFCKYIKSIVKDIKCDEKDCVAFNDMLSRLDTNSFMPKQVDSDNRVIPYQLYWFELNTILEKASTYLPFLNEVEDDISVKEKILSVFTFRVPYFVGPINSYNNKNHWLIRKAEGKIYPWNIEEMVDYDASEQAFINRMTNNCTYLPGEDVLPKCSLLYARFNVLNEINNIQIDGVKITPEQKQKLYEEKFCRVARVTRKAVENFLISENYAEKDSKIEGIDITIKSSLKPYLEFRRLMESGQLNEEQVERIIERSTYTENRNRFKRWLLAEYSHLSQEDIVYISKLKHKDFGRLSRTLLTGIEVTNKTTGELNTVMGWMWNECYNFMQLMSSDFNLAEQIDAINKKYYSEHALSVSERLDEMYVSNSVKRPILRTLDIVKDITKVMGCPPAKVFVEMTRGGKPKQKGKRTQTRKQQLLELYSNVKDEDVKIINKQLEDMGDMADNRLQSEAIFLYFLQLGKCMYTGKPIDLEKIKDGTFNIDHIYPQCYVKDDSILNNKVLVDSKVNAEKTDIYPIPGKIRQTMKEHWDYLREKKLITEEKYKRLTRSTSFSDEEKWGFINRQLVETSQSTKAIATLLKEKFGEKTEIVYVKAGLVSDFRNQVLGMPKSRIINDLHHAKDAYLNIVVGNVYNTRFTKKWFLESTKSGYSLKVTTLFGRPCELANWYGGTSVAAVRKVMQKNAIHFTRYAFCRKGGFFDQMPLKAREGLIPRKEGMDTAKYGGYNKATASFFMLVKYWEGKKSDIMIMPVNLLDSKQVLADDTYAEAYAKKQIGEIVSKKIFRVEFPIGKRVLKVNTVLELDGLRFCIAGKANGGKIILLNMLTSNILPTEEERYVKTLESFIEKSTRNEALVYDMEYDKVSEEHNLQLYDLLTNKLRNKPFVLLPGNPYETIKKGRASFMLLSIKEQVKVLEQIINVLKTCRTGGCDLTAIGGVAKAAVGTLSSKLSNVSKTYSDFKIVDISASGLYEKKSQNLLELL